MNIGRGAVNAVAAILFVLQALSLGFAGSAMASVADGPFGVVCVTLDGDDGSSGPAPIERQHVCPCCAIHCSSAIDIDGGVVIVVVLPLERPVSSLWSEFRVDVAGAAPELRPLSPRAPPAILV
jgi:hypothetical protein